MYQFKIEKLLRGDICKRFIALLLTMNLLISSSAGFYANAVSDTEGLTETYADEYDTSDSDDPNAPKIVTISKFDMEIIDGFTRAEDGGFIWDANSSAAGHTFLFNILFQTSGNGMLEPGQIKITIPASILKNKAGGSADQIEMSVPHMDEVTDEVANLHDWAYSYDENGNIVITNIKTISAGSAFQFNIGYTTTEKTFEYTDEEFCEDFHAELDYLDEKGNIIEERKSNDMKVAIDTKAEITQTNKKNPTELLKTWNPLWGEKPADLGDDYYYLIWEVESTIKGNLTQYYDFSLDDNADDFICIRPEHESGELKVIGYNLAGTGNQYNDDDTVYGLNSSGTRHDYVLTAVPKEWYEELGTDEELVLQNKVTATVNPADGKDDATSATAEQKYALKKPKFTPSLPGFKFDKNGNRRTYQLDLFTDKDTDGSELTPFWYDVTGSGYSYDKTFVNDGTGDDDEAKMDYRNYGKKKLYYELTDNTVAVEGYVGKIKKDTEYTLNKDEYYFTSVGFTYDINMVAKDDPKKELPGNQKFDEETQNFVLTKPDEESGYEVSFDIYGEYPKADGSGCEFQKIATVKAYRTGDGAVTYVDSMKAEITDVSLNGFKVNFLDESCTGYKIVTSDDYYYSFTYTAQPGIRLVKDLDGDCELLKWINKDYGTNDAAKNEDRVTELRVINTAQMDCLENEDTTYYHGEASGTDYQNESTKESSIIKRYTSYRNNPLYKRYEINWSIDIAEYIIGSNTGEGNVPVVQNGGEFFDLLPKGSSVDLSTIRVYRQNNEEVEFTAKTSAGTDNRVLLHVTIAEDQPAERYSMTFTTYHSWEDIAAFGSDILNPAAYVTGNEKMADTSVGGRGSYHDDSMDLMVSGINSCYDDKQIYQSEDGSYYGDLFDRAIFNDEPFDIKAVVMANVGVTKSVKNAAEGTYTDKTVIDADDGEYSYRLRLENGVSTKSIDNVLVDFIENFVGADVKSAWQGTIKSIDVSNLLSKGVIVRVYYSTKKYTLNESDVYYQGENGAVQIVEGNYTGTDIHKIGIRDLLPNKNTHESTDIGNDFWTLIESDRCVNGIYSLEGLDERSNITAIAIDFVYVNPENFNDNDKENLGDLSDPDNEFNDKAKITDDYKYIMDAGEAAYVIVNMDNSNVDTPKTRNDFEGDEQAYRDYLNAYNAHNNIFSASSMFSRTSSSQTAQDSWIEQNYTTVSYRIRSDFYGKKVNADNEDETISGITFNLYGESYYGEKVNRTITTTSNGILEFGDLEVGEYTLVEVECGKDWRIDRTEYTVTVLTDGTVKVTLNGNVISHNNNINDPFVLKNKPRAHADIQFDKMLYDKSGFTKVSVEGAVFRLSGTSDYGTPVMKIEKSDFTGKVFFEDVEQGTYELVEIEAPQGYAKSNVVYEVQVDQYNNWSIKPKSSTELFDGDVSTGYTIGNEKYREFYLQKQSKYGVGNDGKEFLLNGAVFHLYGTTDDGEKVDMEVTSGYSATYGEGIAYFGKLKDGIYYLEEIIAPVLHYKDDNGNDAEQTFYRDSTIYTVEIKNDILTIKSQNGELLPNATYDNDIVIADNLFTFINVPVGGTVVVRKAWVDKLTSEERAEQVESPDIVVSSEKPEPFKNVYAYFDYVSNHSGGKTGKFGYSLVRHKDDIKHFERYAGEVVVGETYIENNIEYCNITIGGKVIKAEVISTNEDDKNHPSPVPIYGWMEDDTYKWYSEAVNAKIVDAWDLFSGVSGIIDVDFAGMNFSETTYFDYMFSKCTNLENVYNLKRPANAVKATASRMFFGCIKLGSNNKLIDLTGFDTTNITDMQMMFQSATNSNSCSDVILDWGSALHTESVTTFFHMFDTCMNLKEIKATTEFNFDSINKTESIQYMFINAQHLVSLPSLTRKKPEEQSKDAQGNPIYFSMFQMFHSCKALTEIDLSQFSTTDVTNMKQTFAYCIALKTLDLSNFDTTQVTDMTELFRDSGALKTVDISSFSKDSLTTANLMFAYCYALETIYANESFNLNDPKITTGDMFNMGNKTPPLKGQAGTTWSSTKKLNGEYARIDKEGQPGYFSLKENSRHFTLSPSSGIFSRLHRSSAAPKAKTDAMLYGAEEGETTDTTPKTEENTNQADDEFYRNSANHGNKSGPSDRCEHDHFFVVRTQEDLEKLKISDPDIYELVKDLKDNEWIYVFTDIIGDELYVWEENVPEGYESDADNYYDDENNVHKVVTVKGGAATVTNKSIVVKYGALAICKTVLDSDSGKDVSDDLKKEFSFEITLHGLAENSPQSLTALYYQTIDPDNTKTERSIIFIDGKATVKIQSGYTLEFSNLLEDMDYTITELIDEDTKQTTVNGEVTEDNTITGKIVADKTISVAYQNTMETDIRDLGSFTLKKEIQNPTGADTTDAEYSFLVEFTNLVKNTDYSVLNGDTVVKTFTSEADGTAAFMVSLKADETLTFENIPKGATYRITETASGAYIASYVTSANESNANTAAGTELSTQWQTMDPDDPINTVFTNKIVKTQSVAVTKHALDGGIGTVDSEEKYKFVAEFSGLGANYQLVSPTLGTFTADANGVLKLTFELKSGETADFTNVPVGAFYSFYEDYNGELIPCSGVFYTDETTGEEISNNSSTPSITNGAEIAAAVAEAEKALTEAQKNYDVASSILSYDKKELDNVIAEIMALLDVQNVDEQIRNAFVADNYAESSYQEARSKIVEMLSETFDMTKLTDAEAAVAKALTEYQKTAEALQLAKEALETARGATYVEGTVLLHQNTTIDFDNCIPFDLTINKSVTGTFGDKLKDFRFKVVFKYNGIPFKGSYTVILKDGAQITDSSYKIVTDNKAESDDSVLGDSTSEADTINWSDLFDDGTVYFVLHDRSSITFKGLPCGTTYEIIEEEEKDYEVYVDGEPSENRTATGSIGPNTEVSYRNNWNGIIADLPGAGTGIGRNLFYTLGIILLLEGVAWALLLYRRKRRQDTAQIL